MKNLTFSKMPGSKNLMMSIILCFIAVSSYGQNNFAVVFDNRFPNIQNLEYVVTSDASTPCGPGELVVTKDYQGRLVSEVNWCQGRRCGIAKIYDRGILVKLIEFYRDLIVSYKSYKNGVLVTEISKDREKIVNQGSLVVPEWDKVYVPISNKEVIILNRKNIIDLLSLLVLPEEISSLFEALNNAAKNSLKAGQRSMFVCGGSVNPINDVETDLKSSDPAKKSAAFGSIQSKVNGCTAGLQNLNSGGFSGTTGINNQQGRIDQANTNMDKMIAGCSAENGNSLISAPEDDWNNVAPYIGPTLAGLKAAAQNGTTAEAIVKGTNITYNAIKVMLISSEPGVVAAPIATTTTAAGIGLLPAIGIIAAAVAVGVVADYGVKKLIDANFNAKDQAEDAAQKAALEAIPTKTPPSSDPVKTPRPDGSGSGRNCERLQRIKDRCNANGWQGWDCQEALKFFGGSCKAYDPREVMTGENGDFVGGNCSDFTQAQKAIQECKKTGMIAMPSEKGYSCRGNTLTADIAGLFRKSWYINPMPVDAKTFRRGDLNQIFSSKSAIKTYNDISLSKLSELIAAAKKPTMIVLMDPDCPSCKTFSASLLSKEVSETMGLGIDIVVIDASANPEINSKYDIMAYPSYLLKKANGTLTPISIGAMSPAETAKFMQSK